MNTNDTKTELQDPLSRRERKKQAARDRILKAGRREIYEKGFAHAAIPDIANHADVGVGTFYLHFDSKETLFKEIINDGFQKLEQEFHQARKQFLDQEEFNMAPFIRSFFGFAWENRELFATMFGSSELAWGVVREWRKHFAKNFEEMIAARAEKKGIYYKNGAESLLASAIIAILANTGLWWMNLLEPMDASLPKIEEIPPNFDEVVNVLNEFIIGGISAAQKGNFYEERGH